MLIEMKKSPIILTQYYSLDHIHITFNFMSRKGDVMDI